MAVKKINFDVKSFIQTLNLSSFSISDLNNMYMKHETCQHLNARTSRQYLHRSVKKLVINGFLKSEKKRGSNAIEYHLTRHDSGLTSNTSLSDVQAKSDEQTCIVLRQKLKSSKLSLLTSIGETEAYKECVEEFPALQMQIQSKYNLARDNTSKLLGKVNAYESLLRLYESNNANS